MLESINTLLNESSPSKLYSSIDDKLKIQN